MSGDFAILQQLLTALESVPQSVADSGSQRVERKIKRPGYVGGCLSSFDADPDTDTGKSIIMVNG